MTSHEIILNLEALADWLEKWPRVPLPTPLRDAELIREAVLLLRAREQHPVRHPPKSE